MEVKNSYLQKALALRREGRIDLALEALELACEEQDGMAWFFKGKALQTGGFGLKRNRSSFFACFKLSAEANCPWGMIEYALFEDDVETKLSWAKKAVASGDEFALATCLGKNTNRSDKDEAKVKTERKKQTNKQTNNQ
jgi:hypothetical protein